MNLSLPGNPRYQPKELVPFFGYDNLFKFVADVEIATIDTLAELAVIPQEDMEYFTPEHRTQLRAITTSEVDKVEREVTKHDIRAWVQLARAKVHPKIARWIHVPLTSYDALDTARSLQFSQAYRQATLPMLKELLATLADMVEALADTVQIGRTHGQHALPITVGFWLANLLSRIGYNAAKLGDASDFLVGKISGAVGAYNAQVGIGVAGRSFESGVLDKLGLQSGQISSQIAPPEPLAYFLHASCMLSASLGQFGRDCRQLMRSEIAEIAEEFAVGQVGSSTMAHKRNPINFENLEGTWLKTKSEYGKVFDSLISEHQRDLVASSLYRDFATIVVNLHIQLNTLLRKDSVGRSFLSRIIFNQSACLHNFEMNQHLVLAEPMYIALQMAGYGGDAHEFVNRKLVPVATGNSESLIGELLRMAASDGELQAVVDRIPNDLQVLLAEPKCYIGLAEKKALEVAANIRSYLKEQKN